MMPSSQKNQQRKVAAVVSAARAAGNANFTHAELGTRSFARTVEKNINEMNEKKSAASTVELPSHIHEKSDVPDNLTFGSTEDPSHLPDRILAILNAHNIVFAEGDRVVHIPGARYFSFVKQVGDQKVYETFSVDEEIPEPIESEPVVAIEPVIEVPIVEPVIAEPVVSSIVAVPVSRSATNTLGTIGVPENVSPTPETAFNAGMFESPFSAVTTETATKITEPVAEPATSVAIPVSQPEPNPTVVVPITEIPAERAPAFSTEFNKEPESIATPIDDHVSQLQKKLKETRTTSNREREAYYASHYRDRVTGKFNELFGNNSVINDELFKTMDEYEQARHNLLMEMGTKKTPFHKVIDWMKQEQKELITMLSHEKYGTYAKLALRFKLPVPSVIETRTGMLSLVSQPSTPIVSTLGIEIPHDVSLWKNLFTTDRAVKLSIANTVSQPNSPSVEQVAVMPMISSVTPEQKKPSINKSELYPKLHDVMARAFGLVTSITTVKPEPVQAILPVATPPEELPTMNSMPTSSEVAAPAPLSFQPEPQVSPLEINPESVTTATIPISSSSLMTKQHPEDLFA